MRVDGRRVVRALGLTAVLFLLVGGGVGFVAAAGEQSAQDALQVPAPRPGDRVAYAVQKTLLPELQLGGKGDVRLDEVLYEWLPETTVLDASFADRLVHPLRATYVFMADSDWEVRYVVDTHYDAATGAPLKQSSDGSYVERQPPIAPGVTGYIGGGIDEMLFPPTQVRYATDVYSGFDLPCGQSTPLHGTTFDGGPVPAVGQCGWLDGNLTFQSLGWDDLPTGRAHGFAARQDARLELWYDSGSPFPARVRASMSEIVDDRWSIGRLFTLERKAWAPGEGAYSPPGPAPATPGHPVPLDPLTPWMLNDAGLGGDLGLERAYLEAEKAPRSTARTGVQGALGATSQPSVREWLAAHPNGYLGDAERYQSIDDYGQANPGWALLWVDGTDWLGKLVTYDATVGDETAIFLPEQTGRRITVADWWPYDGDEEAMASLVATFPRQADLPATLPRGAEAAARFQEGPGGAGPITFYGFRLMCGDDACSTVDSYVWMGHSGSTVNPNTGAAGGSAFLDQLTVDQDGRAVYRLHRERDVSGLLGLGEPGPEDTPAPQADRHVGAWTLPATPAATAGISFLALLGGALYYFWPSLKGLVGFGLFSRIEDDEVLDHPTRRRIHDAIHGEPGIHFQALARQVDVGRGTLDHHLRKLIDADLVVLRRAPGYTCYFPKGKLDRQFLDAAPALRSDGSRAVLQAVAANPGSSSRDIAAQLGLAPSTVSYHLKRLEGAGLVAPGQRAGVHLTPLGAQAKAAA